MTLLQRDQQKYDEGLKEGQLKEQVRLTKKLLAEGKTPEEIATWLEIKENKVNELIEMVKSSKK